MGIFVDVAGVLAHLFKGQVLAPHHLREPLDARERRAELVAHDRDEVGLCPVQTLELGDCGALAFVRLCCGDRDAELLPDRLDEPHLVGRPLTSAVDLREREGAGELPTDPDRGRRGGDDVLCHLVLGAVRVREAPILPDVRNDDRAPEARRESRDGQVLGADTDRGDARGVPLVRDRKILFARAGADEGARDTEDLGELVHRAAEDLGRVEARASALCDAVHERLALGSSLRLLNRERAVDRTCHVLAHDHRQLSCVGCDVPGTFAQQEKCTDEPFTRHEWQRSE